MQLVLGPSFLPAIMSHSLLITVPPSKIIHDDWLVAIVCSIWSSCDRCAKLRDIVESNIMPDTLVVSIMAFYFQNTAACSAPRDYQDNISPYDEAASGKRVWIREGQIVDEHGLIIENGLTY